ncbi:MAG: DciA family protein [Stellaceae bacterium]
MGKTTPRRGATRVTVPAAEREYRGFRAVGVAVSKLTLPIVARRGGGILVRLKAEWAAIVGADWAEVSWPTTLGRDGVLKLRAAPGAALELQHRAPLIIERINLFFGRAVVTRLALVQGPLPLASRLRRPVIPALTEGEAMALDQRLSNIADPDLRAALAQLGRAMSGGQH